MSKRKKIWSFSTDPPSISPEPGMIPEQTQSTGVLSPTSGVFETDSAEIKTLRNELDRLKSENKELTNDRDSYIRDRWALFVFFSILVILTSITSRGTNTIFITPQLIGVLMFILSLIWVLWPILSAWTTSDNQTNAKKTEQELLYDEFIRAAPPNRGEYVAILQSNPKEVLVFKSFQDASYHAESHKTRLLFCREFRGVNPPPYDVYPVTVVGRYDGVPSIIEFPGHDI